MLSTVSYVALELKIYRPLGLTLSEETAHPTVYFSSVVSAKNRLWSTIMYPLSLMGSKSQNNSKANCKTSKKYICIRVWLIGSSRGPSVCALILI